MKAGRASCSAAHEVMSSDDLLRCVLRTLQVHELETVRRVKRFFGASKVVFVDADAALLRANDVFENMLSLKELLIQLPGGTFIDSMLTDLYSGTNVAVDSSAFEEFKETQKKQTAFSSSLPPLVWPFLSETNAFRFSASWYDVEVDLLVEACPRFEDTSCTRVVLQFDTSNNRCRLDNLTACFARALDSEFDSLPSNSSCIVEIHFPLLKQETKYVYYCSGIPLHWAEMVFRKNLWIEPPALETS